MVCDDREFRANLNMLYMVGQLVGSPLSGLLCDRFGRKKVFILCFAGSIIFGVAAAFPVLPEVLLLYRFLNGMLGMAVYLSLYVLSLEFMGVSQRTFAGSMMMLLWLIGPFVVAVLSYLVTDWRYIQILSSAPFVFCLGYYWLIPESPRWLLSKGRVQEATEVVMKVVKVNKLTLPPEGHNADGNTKVEKEQTNGEQKTDVTNKDEELPSESPLKLLKYPNLIARTGIIFFNWCVVSMTYYGLSLNVSNLGGSVRVNFLLSNIVELVGYSAAWLLLDRLGRKKFHCSAMLLAGSALLATIFSVIFGGPEIEWVTTAVAMVGKLGISAAFSSIYLALYIEGSFGMALPLVIFGALAMVAGLLSLFLPETLNQKLPDTILEAANFAKKQSGDVISMEELKQPKKTEKQPVNMN